MPNRTRTRKNLIRSSAAALLAGLAIAGCGGGSGEKQSLNLETFTSPDRNIGCVADDDMVRCDIRRKTWQVKPDPSCSLDYGNGLSVADGPGEIVCAGDTAMNNGPVLGQGSINMVGPFECETDEAGGSMRCENVSTGHGFEMSAAGYEVF